MEKITLGNTNLKVTPICFGTWEIGGLPFFQTPDKQQALRAIHSALDAGINFIDTAPVYGFGRAEMILGEALQNKRSGVILATKCGLFWEGETVDSIHINNSREAIIKDIEGSLRRLRTDHIDLYQVHWPEEVAKTPIKETIETLQDLQVKRKIRFYGVSNFTKEQLQEALKYGSVSTLQNRYSILHTDDQSDEMRLCNDHGIAFLDYSPLHRGLLTNAFLQDFNQSKDPMVKRIGQEGNYISNVKKASQLYEIAKEYGVSLSNLALNYTLLHTRVDVAIVGSKTPAHIGELADVFTFSIKQQDIERIENIICQ